MRRISRSRTGCARCKRQHMKCDEARPACGRCVKARVECPGYQSALRWSRKHEVVGHTRSTDQAIVIEADDPARPPPPASPPQRDPSVRSVGGDDLAQFFHDVMAPPQNKTPPRRRLNLEINSWLGDLVADLAPDDTVSLSNGSDRPPSTMVVHGYNSQSPTPPWYNDADMGLDPLPFTALPSQPFMQSDPQQTPNSPAPSHRRREPSLSIAPPLIDTSTLLADFYFLDTARIFSVYDGGMNPFRSLVSRLWGQSRVIYCAMQSMAAATLEGLYPHLGPLGRTLRREAVDLLMSNEDCDETSLLALLMIGASTSWHDATDSGVMFFVSFQRRLGKAITSDRFLENSNNYRFFHESSVYWRMLLAHVVDDNKLGSSEASSDDVARGPNALSRTEPPHPWTGIGREAQYILSEIAHLVRSQRQQAHIPAFATHRRIDTLRASIVRASYLEARLSRMTLPREDRIINPEDRNTPVQHLITLAQMYRLVGLLQVYHVFPDVLRSRLVAPIGDVDDDLVPFFEAAEPAVRRHSGSGLDLDIGRWLTAFSLRILDLFREVPVESGTCAFQPFILVACGGELRVPSSVATTFSEPVMGESVRPVAPAVGLPIVSEAVAVPSAASLCMSIEAVRVMRARNVVLGRLETLLRLLPPKPQQQCIFVLEELWRKMDETTRNGGSEFGDEWGEALFWMDIMIENGWETMMG